MNEPEYMVDLKKRRIWVCVRLIRGEDGHIKKIPRSAQGKETGSDEAHSSTWVTYEEAKEASEKLGYDGVGFVIPEGYFFLDIDHKDTADPFVRKMLKLFNGKAYAELSVSGNGLHFYGKCDSTKLPTETDKEGKRRVREEFYINNQKEGLEVYFGGFSGKIATFTGKAIQDSPLKDCTDAVLSILDKYMRKPDRVENGSANGKKMEDSDIVIALRKQKNGAKFSALYDDGDISDYNSPSEADEALCSMIAFRTGPDTDAIDRIFRKSRLYQENDRRNKWNREDYRNETIRKAIDLLDGNFHYSVRKREDTEDDRPPFVLVNENGDKYVFPPLLAKYTREHMHILLLEDDGKQGGKTSQLKYVYDEKAGVYRLCSDNMCLGYIKQFVANYDERLIKMSQMTEVLRQIDTDLDRVTVDELDTDEELINMKNGLLRVTKDKLELLPHDPKVLSTIQIPVNWPEDPLRNPPETPKFDDYMSMLTDGRPDVERLLLEFMGVCLSNVPGWRMKKALFMYGPGNSGKSQLRSLVERLLGRNNCASIDMQEIEARFGAGFIYGTRMAGTGDMSYMTIKELKTFKMITGGDSLSAEFKGRQPFKYVYNGLLWFCMNHLPRFGGDDGSWVYDRILPVECPNSIPAKEQNKRLLDEMYEERDGIVYKAVKALQTVMDNGYKFSEPETVLVARKAYRNENDSVAVFFKECMETWPEGKPIRYCTTGRVYKVYKAWCGTYNGGYAKNIGEFRESLVSIVGAPSYDDMLTRRNGQSYFKDFCLTPAAKCEFRNAYGQGEDPDLDDFLRD